MATYQADTTFVPVIPSFRGFSAAMSRGILPGVRSTGLAAGVEFARSFASKATRGTETVGAVQKRIASDTAAAAKTVKAAMSVEEDAARRVRIEELKLQELRTGGNAKASQLAAAEDRLARSQKVLAGAQDKTALATQHQSDSFNRGNTSLLEAEKRSTLTSRAYSAMGTAVKVGAVGAGLAVLGLGTAAARGLGSTIKPAQDFQSSIRQVGVATGVSGKGLTDLGNVAQDFGAKTSFSAQGASDAMLALAKGGLTAAQIKGGALASTLTLATAGGLDLGHAADYMVQGLTSFGLSASRSGEVAAALAGGANASTASVESLGLALSQVGPGAKTAGVSLQDTVAVLAAFDNAGIKGNDAGTSLKNMFVRLVPSTKSAHAAMEGLGLITADGSNKFFDATGKLKSMGEVSQILQTALQGQTKEQKISTLQTIFGNDAARAAAVLADNGAKGLAVYTKATNDQAQAQLLAKSATQGYAGAQEALSGGVDSLKIRIGTYLLPVLTQVSRKISGDILPAIDGWVQKIGPQLLPALASVGNLLTTRILPVASSFGHVLTGTVIPAVGGLAHLLGGSLFASATSIKVALGALFIVMGANKLGGAAGALQAYGTRLQSLGGVATATQTRVGGMVSGLGRTVSFLGGPWGIAIGIAASALVGLATKHIQAARDAKQFTDSLTFQNGALDANSVATIRQKTAKDGIYDATSKAGVSEKAFTDALTGGKGPRDAMIAQLNGIVSAHTSASYGDEYGRVTTDEFGLAAKKAADYLKTQGTALDDSARGAAHVDAASKPATTSVGKLGDSAELTRRRAGGLAGAAQGAATATDKLGGAAKGTAPSTDALRKSAGLLQQAETNLARETQKIINQFTILKTGALDQESANSAWQSSLDGLSGALQGAGKSTDKLNTARVAEEAANRKVQIAEKRLQELHSSGKASTAQIQAAEDRLKAARDSGGSANRKVQIAESRLKELRDSGKASASQIMAAEDRLRTAKDRQKAAADRVRTAEQRVNDLRSGGGKASASQLMAAEDRLKAAKDRLKTASDKVTASQGKQSHSLDINTEKGRTNRTAIVDAMRAMNDKATADFKANVESKGLTRATDIASGSLKTNRKRLEDAAVAAGYSRTEVHKMIGQYVLTPNELKTAVSTPGSKAALQAIKDHTRELNKVPPKKSTTVETQFKFSASKLAATVIKGDYFNNPGAFQPKRAGGPIQNLSGKGRPGVDTEPVLAAVDEHMINNREVDGAGGHGAVFKIRRMMADGSIRNLLHLRDGGPVNGARGGNGTRRRRYPYPKALREIPVPFHGPGRTFDEPKLMDSLSKSGNRAGASYSNAVLKKMQSEVAKAKAAADAAAAAAAAASGGGSYGTPGAGTYGGTRFSSAQLQNAATIAAIGRGMGRQAQQIGLMTAMQESTLRNLPNGDADSVGLFQQRAAWGSFGDRHNPRISASMFFHGGHGGQRGLDDIAGWRGMSLGRAAQRVQQSAFPGAYTKWAGEASAILSALSSAGGGGGGPVAGGGFARGLQFARSQAGKGYLMGAVGPSRYDCSGLMAAIANVVRGRSPYHRTFSTGDAAGGPAHMAGFTRNKNSAFRIGIKPASGKYGHTAGTINGVNVESAGGVGVRVGPRARGWNNGLFSLHYGLKDGGPVRRLPRGDAPYDTLARDGQRYDPKLRAVVEGLYGAHFGTYDKGGWLQPGLNVAFNGVGRRERVPDPTQVDMGRLHASDRALERSQHFNSRPLVEHLTINKSDNAHDDFAQLGWEMRRLQRGGAHVRRGGDR